MAPALDKYSSASHSNNYHINLSSTTTTTTSQPPLQLPSFNINHINHINLPLATAQSNYNCPSLSMTTMNWVQLSSSSCSSTNSSCTTLVTAAHVSPPNSASSSSAQCMSSSSSSTPAAAASAIINPLLMPVWKVAPRKDQMMNPRKRRRVQEVRRSSEDVENQRMTHIAVERNRRRMMNEHLTVLRSLMPESFIQRGDQASIIGGAVDFLKKLEQILMTLEVEKWERSNSRSYDDHPFAHPFSDFFSSPQYSTSMSLNSEVPAKPATSDIQVSMTETHVNLRLLSLKTPKQLLKLVTGLESMGLMVLHVTMTAMDYLALYSFSLKVEEECLVGMADDIAAAVNELMNMIQEEGRASVLDQYQMAFDLVPIV